jgi:hypothetical protein
MSGSDTSAFEERMFWDSIEAAWKRTPGGRALRREIWHNAAAAPGGSLAPFLSALDRVLGELTAEGLRTFGREFDRALFTLDREDLAKHVGLGDDGFLDARSTIVVLGEERFRGVVKDVGYAVRGLGIEQASYAFAKHWEKRFGAPAPSFGIPTCTASNPDGWPRARERQAAEARVTAAVEHLSAELRLGAREPRLAPGGFLKVSMPNLAPRELAAVLRRVARIAEGGE